MPLPSLLSYNSHFDHSAEEASIITRGQTRGPSIIRSMCQLKAPRIRRWEPMKPLPPQLSPLKGSQPINDNETGEFFSPVKMSFIWLIKAFNSRFSCSMGRYKST
ncbi:Uncharacterized protein HZ326_19372 [Fusarium oxysporum f. sp. albedinis]|nr:Uncharacterized protein HZ326_19372 [Fusarium oxysporum f. sp. albedinis]